MLLSDVCLSVAYIGRNWRTERPRKTKIGTKVAHMHVTRDSDASFKIKRSKVNLIADVLNSQHAGIGATWRINTKILSTCRARRHIVAAARHIQLVEGRVHTYCLACNQTIDVGLDEMWGRVIQDHCWYALKLVNRITH